MRGLRLLLVLVLTAGMLGIFGMSMRTTMDYLKERNPGLDRSNLSVMLDEEHALYLSHAGREQKFQVKSDGSMPDLVILDSEGTQVPYRYQKERNGVFTILAPEGGYLDTNMYQLQLGEHTVFADQDMADARKLNFSIEREEQFHWQFAPEVQVLTQSMEPLEDNRIRLNENTSDYAVGDVLIYLNDEESEAYQIVKVYSDGTTEVEIPELDELFSDIEIYGVFTPDFTNVKLNEEMAEKISENFQKSEFFQALMMKAYAADIKIRASKMIEVSVTRRDSGADIKIAVTFKPDEDGKLFGIQMLGNHTLKLSFNISLEPQAIVDIRGTRHIDVGSWLKVTTTIDVKVSPNSKIIDGMDKLGDIYWEKENSGKGTGLDKKKMDQAETKSLGALNIEMRKKVIQQLKEVSEDLGKGSIDICYIPIPVPGKGILNVGIEVAIELDMGVAIDFASQIKNTYSVTVGVIYENGNFRPYTNTNTSGGQLLLSVVGKGNAKAGISAGLEANLINEKVAKVGAKAGVGAYAEGFVTLPLLKPEEIASQDPAVLDLYSELGVYIDYSLEAGIKKNKKTGEYKIGLDKAGDLWKKPFLTVGTKKIPYDLEILPHKTKVRDGKVVMPDFKFFYYDVTKADFGTEVLKARDKKLKFTVQEGAGLRIQNGDIVEDGSTPATGEAYVTVTYKPYTIGHTYSSTFSVLLKSGALEGVVYTYDPGTEQVKTVSDARIHLLGKTDMTVHTGTDGGFSVNLPDGSYQMDVTADGYLPLSSVQHVQNGEITYTEQLMMIDEAENGIGAAGGQLLDAINGQGVGNAFLQLRRGWNQQNGELVNVTAMTSSNGSYEFTKLPAGYYTIQADKEGYHTSFANIVVQANHPQNRQNFTISPALPDGQMRIVLRWGEFPHDLDSHLIGHTPDNKQFHVYFHDQIFRWEQYEIANLDVDDRVSYGPETITILQPVPDGTVYAVHDYSNRSKRDSTALSNSGAVVTVYTGGRQDVQTFYVPSGHIGTYWNVFRIKENQIEPINTMSNDQLEW